MRPAHLAFAVTVVAACSTTTASAQEPVRSQIKATLTVPGRPPAFAVFGTELTYGHYRATAHLPRIPCPGAYRFTAVGANLRDGTTSEYVGELALKRLKISGTALACGATLPARFGRSSARVEMVGVSSQNRDRRIALTGARVEDGAFNGVMDITSIFCPGPYRLLAAFRDRHDHQIRLSYRFVLTRATVDGQDIGACL